MGTCECCHRREYIKESTNNTNNYNNNYNFQQQKQNQEINSKKNFNNNNNQYNENSYKNFWLKNSIEEAHNDAIVNLIELHNKKIMTCSYDKSMKVWNIDAITKKITCEEVIPVENKIMCLLEFEPNKILFGSQTAEIGLMDLAQSQSKKELFFFRGHLLGVNCLVKLNQKLFASASNDTDIRIWDYYNRQCIKILSGHDSNIFCLIKLNDNLLCSSGADKIIKIFNWEENKCVYNSDENNTWIKSLLKLNNRTIISGSDDGVIKFWGENESQIKAHEDSVRNLCNIGDKYIASSSFDKTVKIWDIKNRDCVQILHGHLDKVICVLFHSDGYLITCSNDKTIKIWEQDKNYINLNTNLY